MQEKLVQVQDLSTWKNNNKVGELALRVEKNSYAANRLPLSLIPEYGLAFAQDYSSQWMVLA